MKFSRMFMPTTKETPSDATLASHQYLIRGGFISQSGAGLYDFLPLGKIVLDKIRAVVKEEMDNAGANEMLCSFVTPMSFWEESGRNLTMGSELLRFKDRKNGEYVLSPTNEESVVNMVKNRITSYKNLPLNLYHINTKFRDEARPRFGLMRGREFLMKDAYSFHASQECLIEEFNNMEEAYKRVYSRLGLDFRIVEADSGAIGGSGSKEFHVLANSGEDTIVVCPTSDYAANIEAANRQPVKKEALETTEVKKVHTPALKSIEEVTNFLEVDPYYSMKAVIKKAIYEENTETVVFFVRGTDELEETKACNAVNALEIEDATEEDLEKAGLVAGFCGIVDFPKDIRVIFDIELKGENNLVCGANEVDYHLTGVNLNDFDLEFANLYTVKEGDLCPISGGKLEYTKGIEAGHIFQLGTKYSEAMDARFLDANGKTQPFIMGCYGIGVSRLVAAVIEQNHDDKGCIWTKETAPFLVDVIVSNAKKEDELEAGMKIYEGLKANGISTIIDDRTKERFGFKMGDFELIGFPYAIVIGKKLKEGMVEIVDRKTGEKTDVSIDEAVAKVTEILR